jgi:hypothetical protein
VLHEEGIIRVILEHTKALDWLLPNSIIISDSFMHLFSHIYLLLTNCD